MGGRGHRHPQGLGFFDAPAVEAQTGRPIRSAWRAPGDPRPFPAPDAVAVAPATFNTVNKWAAGISDTLALGTLNEAYGLDVPIAVLPCVSDALASHPAYRGASSGCAGWVSGSATATPGSRGRTVCARSSPGERPWTCSLLARDAWGHARR